MCNREWADAASFYAKKQAEAAAEGHQRQNQVTNILDCGCKQPPERGKHICFETTALFHEIVVSCGSGHSHKAMRCAVWLLDIFWLL